MSKKRNNNANEIPKSYDSNKEMDIYKLWEESGYLNPEKMMEQNPDKDPFVITLPPPNANGELHVGHTCGYSFQDCMGRFNRMKGRPTLLLPGKDHAGIQTESVFTEKLASEGVDKWELGREEFNKQAYEFCIKNSEHARNQEKRIGVSADWTREKFTLDPKLTEVVYTTFQKMFEDGLIYRGKYIVNQCTNCRTALADIDTEHETKKGIFAYIKYPLADNPDEHIMVATTRPETMLGDTAVAVNPKDDRYKDLIGKKVNLPLTDREIPIIGEHSVDIETGTGALKVTPAHSSIDYEIGYEHELEILNVIDKEGNMSENAPEKYQGMSVKECKQAVLDDLEELDLLEKVEEIEHDVIVCERCRSVIEQIVSKQWFADMKSLAAKAIDALDSGDTKVLPSGKQRALRHWLKNIRPWCLSRQLWWGHRIPVWYCGTKELFDWLQDNPDKTAEDFNKENDKNMKGCGHAFFSDEKPDKCPKCGKDSELNPETDIFDTWYSSGQWTFSTMGGVEGEDFKKFYPTDVMETMHDILFFWVARMMMLGIYRTGETPFHTVFLHGMILAPDGQKMAKSKGNGVEPDDVYPEYGADALRLWYYTDALPGKNTPIRMEKLQGNRNFVNKIWNASRYVMLQVKDENKSNLRELGRLISSKLSELYKTEDTWLKTTYEAVERVTDHLDNYRFNLGVEKMREFFWHTFCDEWIEDTKNLIDENPDKKDDYLARLIAILVVNLKLLHPFVPFVSETIWQELRKLNLLEDESDLLMVSEWPISKS